MIRSGPGTTYPRNLFGAGMLVLILLAYYRGFLEVFRGFMIYDDEGYFLLNVKRFLAGHALYTDVFSQYGPGYYAFEWVLHAVFKLPLTHDIERYVATMCWVAASGLIAWAAFQITGSAVFALAMQCVAFFGLIPLAVGPGHPQELVVALLAAALAVSAGRKPAPIALGIVAGCLLLIKINVGVFFVVALGLALLAASENARMRQLGRLAALAGCALPAAMMLKNLGTGWVLRFALLSTAILIAFVIALSRVNVRERIPVSTLWRATIALAATVIAIAAFTWLHGTPPADLFTGVALRVLALRNAYFIPAIVHTPALLVSLISIAAVASYKLWATPRLLAIAKIVFGLAALLLFATQHSGFALNFITPFAWLALCGSDGEGASFQRILWTALAVFEALQSYPVYGVQVCIGALPTIGTAVICMNDGYPLLKPDWPVFRSRWIPAALVLLFVLAAYGVSTIRARNLYQAADPLDLPGTARIRGDKDQMEQYRWLTRNAKANFDVFVTLPGLDSFYIWTGEDPPTSLNPTSWMGMLNSAEQQQVIAAISSHPQAGVIYAPGLLRFYLEHGASEHSELARYLMDNFHEAGAKGGYRLLARNDRTAPIQISER